MVVLFYVQNQKVFFNSFIHMLEYSAIVTVDMERNTWRTIRKPGGAKISIHQTQACVCAVLIFVIGLSF
jgi:hypothetical protein